MAASSNRPLPRTIVLELTHACNHQCKHCYATWEVPQPTPCHSNDKPLTLSGWKKLIAQVQKDVPTLESVALSGGEPLLFNELTDLVQFITSRNLSAVVITNGSFLTRPRLLELSNAGAFFEVPILSYQPNLHDQLTGRPGSWHTVIDNLANMIPLEGRWVAVFVAMRPNWKDLKKTAELAIALGAEGLMYNRMNLSANNLASAKKLLPTPFMLKQNLRTLEALKTQYNFPSAVSVVIEPCVVDITQFPNIRFGWCPLAGENSYFTIDPYGNVRICNHSPTILGNLTRTSFLTIYRRNAYVRRFRTELPAECLDCPPKWQTLCQGGCKATGEQCYGDLTKIDPFVTMYRKTSVTAP
jgi:radical SAM protein with 4Fe4S-binding SPASM domain